MNKKLLALAVAAAMTAPVVATAAPTVGGMLQVEIGSVSNDGYGENNGTKNRGGFTRSITAGNSGIKVTDNKRGRLWIKGSEDLGGGMKANYKFEWQVDTPIGQLNDGGREGWVGLSGGFGAVELGRIKSPYKYTGGVKYDPFVTTYMEARKSGGMIGGGFAQNSFWSDSISWKKKFGAMRIWINLGLDDGTGATGG
ncbi:MAG: porin, partial [Thiohalomonadales bacterium]